MTTYYLNGNIIPEGSDFNVGNFIYPYSWLETSSAANRSSMGIEKTGDVNYDTKYYWGVEIAKDLEDREELQEDGSPAFVKIYDEQANDGLGGMVDSDVRLVTLGLKSTCTSEVKTTTNNLLHSTDYFIIRNEVEGLDIPADVTTYRAAVIAESDRVTTAINGVTTVEELIEVMSSITWPEVN